MPLRKKRLLILMLALPVALASITFVSYKLFRKMEYRKERVRALDNFKPFVFKSDVFPQVIPYRLFLPHHYKKSKKLPLILYLHGGGSKGVDNEKQIEAGPVWLTTDHVQNKYPSIIVAPQCPLKRKWMDKPGITPPFTNHNQDLYPESDVMKALVALLDDISQKYSVDISRMYITGYSMGATGTWDFVTRHPDLFAAAVILNGENDPTKGRQIIDLPIWAFHGRRDDVAPVENTREMVDSIRKHGGKKVKYTEYFLKGHGIDWQVYLDKNVIHWLFQQKKM